MKHLNSLKDNQESSRFSNLTKLETLVLDGNPLKRIGEYVFSDLKSLRNLCLNNSQLTLLGPNSEILEMLDLKNNKLTNFDFGILNNFRLIKEIDLSGNPISNKDLISYPLENGGKVLFKY